MKWSTGLALTAALLLMSTHASARVDRTFRKCTFKVMITGENLPATEVPGARFTAWARAFNHATGGGKKAASRDLNRAADKCVQRAFTRKDPREVPKACKDNPKVHDSAAISQGISGFQLTRPHTALKATICKHHKRSGKVRTLNDHRTIPSFRVYLQKVSGNGSCKTRNFMGPVELKIQCRGEGKDKKWDWFYKK